jgi:uncharacterized protein (TIGR01777 family)
MTILLTGATGLIGSALKPFLEKAGHRVIPLVRSTRLPADAPAVWNLTDGRIHLNVPGRLDGVVHLAGETIAQRWTAAAKARIRASRVEGTRRLCEALVQLVPPPEILLSTSAVGIYGNRADEPLDERSAVGEGFLAETCRAWEAATDVAAARGIRVAHLRLGIVLTPRGGALARMLPAFRLGLGGRLGDGRQYWSWIALEDLLAVVKHALDTESLSGPVNGVAPGAVTNAEFARALAAALGRPAIFQVPRFAVSALFGQMGREALLSSARVVPRRLEETGFQFRYPALRPALQTMFAD